MSAYYCDNKRHLVCIPYSVENLHAMAEDLGIKRCWFHRHGWPHYDIPNRRVKEITSRCTVLTSRELMGKMNASRLHAQSRHFHAFEWLRGQALNGNRHAEVLMLELIELNKLKFRVEKTKGKCMVCGDLIDISTAFGLATGLGVCGKPACRDAFTEAGIV